MALKQVSSVDHPAAPSNRPSKRLAAENHFEKLWLADPEQFNPERTALSRDYFHKVKGCFDSKISGKKCVDLGSGYGALSKALAALGADVTAVDIAPSALKKLEGLKTEQHFFPYSSLPDEAYDYVIAENLIAEVPEAEYRLFFSELARIVKPDGYILLSTPLDINSEDALHRLIYLAETEIALDSLTLSYHRIFLGTLNLFKKTPLIGWLENQDWLLHAAEKLTKFFYDQEGVSYAILIGKRRPLFEPIPENEQPIESKGKKTIWE